MIVEDLLDRFRREMNDVTEPPLWPDEDVLAYMDDAQKLFCRKGGGIADATTTDITEIDFNEGDDFIDTDKRIIKIRKAQRQSDFRDIELLNFEDLERRVGESDYGVNRVMRIDDRTGPLVSALVLGMEPHKARLMPIPDAGDTIRLVVYRMPLEDVTEASLGKELEIDEKHQPGLLYWMKALAYSKQDAEVSDKTKAKEFEDKFMAYCEEAKHERELSEHKYRAVNYGGY